MTGVAFSIITPTVGRKTLAAAVASAAPQLAPGDEILILRDASGDSGDTARNDMIARARGTHLIFLDDDDELRPNALATARAFASENPGRIGIFRMSYGPRGLVWQREGDLWHTAGSMYVVPNVPGKLGRWAPPDWSDIRRCGDWTFISETVALQGEPIWRRDVLVEIRPEKNPWRRFRYKIALRTRIRRGIARIRPGDAPAGQQEWRPPEAPSPAQPTAALESKEPSR